jgi:superfamily II DNA or RNA helicase
VTDLSSIQLMVPAAVRQRGEAYFRQRHVDAVRPVGDGVVGVVHNDTGNRYRVELRVEDDVLYYSCSCPHFDGSGAFCKHAWALVLSSANRDLLPFHEVQDLMPGDEVDDLELPTPIPFRPALPSSRAADWRSRIRSVHAAPLYEEPEEVPEQIVYLIAGLGNSLFLSVRGRSRTRTGGWKKARRIDLSDDLLPHLDPEDREILSLVFGRSYGGFENLDRVQIRPSAAPPVVRRLAATGRLFLEAGAGAPGDQLTWDGDEPWRLSIRVLPVEGRDSVTLAGAFMRDGESLPLDDAQLLASTILVRDGLIAPLHPAGLEWLSLLRTRPPLEVPNKDRQEFATTLLERSSAQVELPPELQWQEEEATALPILRLRSGADREGEGWSGRLTVGYGEFEVEPGAGPPRIVSEQRVIERDLTKESGFVERLTSLRLARDYWGMWKIRPALATDVLMNLVGAGWMIEIDDRAVRLADGIEAEVESGIDWLDLSAGARFGDEVIPLPRLLADRARGRSLVTLSDGSIGLVTGAQLERFAALEGLEATREGRYRFSRNQALLIDAMLALRGPVRGDQGFATLRERLASAAEVRPEQESSRFHGELRPYQREGLGWMLHLRELGTAGCLADDMGLGKTVQLLALLDRVASEKPSLVVAPRSLLFNWKEEAARFTPHLRVLEYHGSGRQSEKLEDYDLILTTYGTLRADIEELSKKDFAYAVLDEAQAIKNAGSQTAKAVRLLRSDHRLALSGTPIENHIGELWSLFEFLIPGALGSARWFRQHFGGKAVSDARREALGRALRPLILRRTKEQVAPDLPEKVEQTLWCELEPDQRKTYEELRLFYRQTLLGDVAEKGMGRSTMQILEALLRLRQAACHPGLISGDAQAVSAKLDLLMIELGDILDSGHRVLVFSQFTTLLGFVAQRLKKEKTAYLYLDGQTRDRKSVVDQFQSENGPPIFLISLKAGGTGLNLTNADYVFLLDPWWNPAVESQAIDRTHRIGQKNKVFAYRIIARDTIEEKILELQQSKRELADAILTEENGLLQKLDLADLDKLLS